MFNLFAPRFILVCESFGTNAQILFVFIKNLTQVTIKTYKTIKKVKLVKS